MVFITDRSGPFLPALNPWVVSHYLEQSFLNSMVLVFPEVPISVPGKEVWNLRRKKIIDPYAGFTMPIKKLGEGRWGGGPRWSRYT